MVELPLPPPRALLPLAVTLLLLAGCRQMHGPERQRIDGDADCVVCHQADFDATTAPPHAGVFPTQCGVCHNEVAWAPAVDVAHDWFPLEHRHAEVECATCHAVGYAPGDTPNQCVGCHLEDYRASTFPGHDAFGTNCVSCHSTAGWSPATGGHPNNRFPINGDHDFACADCHDASRGPSTMGINTDCVGCHVGEHTRRRMDREHDEVRNYPFGTTSVNFCLDCHPNGRE